MIQLVFMVTVELLSTQTILSTKMTTPRHLRRRMVERLNSIMVAKVSIQRTGGTIWLKIERPVLVTHVMVWIRTIS